MSGPASGSGKLSRAEFRRQKDLEEDRKAGRAPAEVDEDGNIINPHVPAYMAQAPWYMDTGSRSLKHQKKPVDPSAVKAGINDWYHRGSASSSTEPIAFKKFRKGACENCGSMSHKTRDCLERPRKKGAKQLGKTLAADEKIQHIEGLDYAAKRDRWNGYDPSEHRKLVEEFEAIEQERRRLKEEQIDNQTSSDLKHAKKLAQKSSSSKPDGAGDQLDFSSDDSDDSDDEKYAEKADAVGQKVDTDKRMTIRNLRIREDRAKYLYNLDVNSAYYDPKTRTMREAPNPNIRPEEAEYAGDNFVRAQGGDANNLAKLQLFSWQAEARGHDLNLQANPTANERQYREFKDRKDKLRDQTKGSILEKYGGAEHFDSLPKELLTGQTEHYVEYDPQGKIVKGLERPIPKSRYEEDVYENNHTSVWGSWYDLDSATWGYRCCHSTLHNSYCTGQAGIEASKSTFTLPTTSSNTATASAIATDTGAGAGTSKDKASNGKSRNHEDDRHRHRRRRRDSARRDDSDSESHSDVERDAKSNSRPKSSGRHHDSKHRKRRRRSYSYSSRSGSGSEDEDSASDYSSASVSTSSSRSDSRSHGQRDRRNRHRRRRSDRDHAHPNRTRRRTEKSIDGYVSKKGIGEGDVAARLDKAKLEKAILEERAKTDPVLARQLEEARKHKEAMLPDWVKDAERVNAKINSIGGGGGAGAGAGGDAVDVSEEQLEAYRLVNRHGAGGVSEDPMANYRDSDELVPLS
ncbi:hypothetical protein BCV70DRAFT_201416 [Testicularia cyperi]|uniref:Pre-mRNA-splicing factor SLU7 n=1 Tax=Testicularia cyperi TaxID=1882483 RepID=A0A317XLK8_9BASI|nr:hypothetical protein BCV70DRAFT_201416 [Testicularia cyperi]